jgi:hypothetical protein
LPLTDLTDLLRDFNIDIDAILNPQPNPADYAHADGVPFREAHHEQLMLDLCQWAKDEKYIGSFDIGPDANPPQGAMGGVLWDEDNPDGRLMIFPGVSSETRLRITFHELAHAIGFGDKTLEYYGDQATRTNRSFHSAMASLEVGAESVAKKCMASIGYDTSRFSDPYIAEYRDEIHSDHVENVTSGYFHRTVNRTHKILLDAACAIRTPKVPA